MFTDDIKLWRDSKGIAQANIKQIKVFHSPDGFEWGYEGSGPADLALNILLLFVDEKQAVILHQKFKREIIGTIKREGGTIKNKDICEWLSRKLV